jgi:predicted nucleic acid-binding protein
VQSFTVVLDACVLVPISATDTLLRLAERDLFRPVWSERIVEEASQAVSEIHPDFDEAQIDHRFANMNAAFEDAVITGWEPLDDSLVLPDAGDRHVVACALVAGADAIVTNNIRDFPPETLDVLNIEVITLDDFLLDIIDHTPEEVVAVITQQVRDARHPPLTSATVLAHLAAAGAPAAAHELVGLMGV